MGGKNSDPQAVCSIPRSRYLEDVRRMTRQDLLAGQRYYKSQTRLDEFGRFMLRAIEKRLEEIDSDNG